MRKSLGPNFLNLILPVLEIGFGPPTADFGSIWSTQKASKFRHFQKHHKCLFCILTPQSLNQNTLIQLNMNIQFSSSFCWILFVPWHANRATRFQGPGQPPSFLIIPPLLFVVTDTIKEQRSKQNDLIYNILLVPLQQNYLQPNWAKCPVFSVRNGNRKGMKKSIPIVRERESEAFILGNGREREFPLTPAINSTWSKIELEKCHEFGVCNCKSITRSRLKSKKILVGNILKKMLCDNILQKKNTVEICVKLLDANMFTKILGRKILLPPLHILSFLSKQWEEPQTRPSSVSRTLFVIIFICIFHYHFFSLP